MWGGGGTARITPAPKGTDLNEGIRAVVLQVGRPERVSLVLVDGDAEYRDDLVKRCRIVEKEQVCVFQL